jgi:putative transposase
MAGVPEQPPEVIAAFGFFTVPTIRFRTLYCFFVIEDGRRRILHFNCTAHANGDWIVQQLREALPLPCPDRYICSIAMPSSAMRSSIS